MLLVDLHHQRMEGLSYQLCTSTLHHTDSIPQSLLCFPGANSNVNDALSHSSPACLLEVC